MGKEALLPGSIEPGKFYDFIGDKEAFNDLGLEEGEVIVFMIKMVSELKRMNFDNQGGATCFLAARAAVEDSKQSWTGGFCQHHCHSCHHHDHHCHPHHHNFYNCQYQHAATISYFTEPDKPTGEGSKVLVTVKDLDGNRESFLHCVLSNVSSNGKQSFCHRQTSWQLWVFIFTKDKKASSNAWFM